VISEGIESATAEGEHDTLIDLALLGIRVEADALAAGARRRQGIASATRELATEHWIRLRATVSDDPTTSTVRERAILASAAAESAPIKAWHGQAGAHGGWSGAAAAWNQAMRAWDAAGHAYQAAYCRWRLAESLVTGRLDREAARLALQDSVTQAGRLAAEPLAREAEALARRARLIQLAPPVAHGPDTLTPQSRAHAIGLSERESEVLALIAEGLSDREIGERLFITTKTTGHHVSHILAKVGLERRGEAAALAFRLGLVEPPA
jgi:DNA-binding CsgD family transcriptional regulator